MNAAALISAPLAGLMIDQLGFPRGWESVWLLALFTGLLATAFYSRIPEREIAHATPKPPAPPADKGGMLNDRNFIGFCAVTFLWNLALYIAAPFFNVHLIRNMGGSESWVGILLAVNSVSALAGQAFVGRLMDQRGARWLMAVSGFAIVTLPLGWLAVTEPWHVLFINGAGGAMWAAYNLAWFSLLLYISPASKRAFYSAVNQMMVYAAAFVGPLIGGALGELYGLPFLFLVSGLGRLVAAGLFLPLVKELPGDAPAAAVLRFRLRRKRKEPDGNLDVVRECRGRAGGFSAPRRRFPSQTARGRLKPSRYTSSSPPSRCCRSRGSTSINRNPSRSTVSPALTSMGRANMGPSQTKVWNSPFSPQGSTESGSRANSASS